MHKRNCVNLDVGDDCVVKSDSKLCIVRNIICVNRPSEMNLLIIDNFGSITLFFDYPLSSSLINIYKVSQPTGVLEVLNARDILRKCVKLPLSDDSLVVFQRCTVCENFLLCIITLVNTVI